MVRPQQPAVAVQQRPAVGPGAEEIDGGQEKQVELDAVGEVRPGAEDLRRLSAG